MRAVLLPTVCMFLMPSGPAQAVCVAAAEDHARTPMSVGETPEGQEPTPADINVKRTASIEVFFIEHTGPYWSLGPRFATLREYMLAHNQSGPIYTRFLDDPAGQRPGSVRSEIGFALKGNLEPVPPFTKARRGGELVAYLTIDSTASTAQSYKRLRDWIDSHEYAALGPVTEVYPPLRPGTIQEQRTEIQMPIRPASATNDVTASPAAELQPATVEPMRPGPAGPDPVDQPALMSEVSDSTSPAVKTHEPPRERSGVARSDGRSEPSEVGEPPPSDRFPPETEPPGDEPSTSIKDLIAAGQFERVARSLVPDDRPLSQPVQIWLGQLVHRIGAAGRGVERLYPGEGSDLVELANAIVTRYQSVESASTIDPLAPPTTEAGPGGDARAIDGEAVMRNLDKLLGEIALRNVNPPAVLDRIADILQQACDLLGPQER